MYKKDLALNNLQWLICHETQPNQIVYAKLAGAVEYTDCISAEGLETFPLLMSILDMPQNN